jgi:hypothetical protein
LLLLLLTIGLLRGSRELVTVSLVLVAGLAEEHATVSLVAVLVTGALAGAALALRRQPGAGVWLSRVAWGALALSTVLLGWTGWSGGRIRHEEVRAAAGVRHFAPGEKD